MMLEYEVCPCCRSFFIAVAGINALGTIGRKDGRHEHGLLMGAVLSRYLIWRLRLAEELSAPFPS